MQHPRPRGTRIASVARVVLVVALLDLPPAAADVIVQADGMADVGYTDTTVPGETRAYLEARPALLLQLSRPRTSWRTRYVFAGALDLTGDNTGSYSNELSLSVATELSPRSALLVTGTVAQGRPEFHLSQRPADAGEPTFRSSANPALATAAISESYVREVSPRVRVAQGLAGAATAPEDALRQYNASISAFVSLSRERRSEEGQAARDAFGGALRSTFSVLREPSAPNEPYHVIANALVADWNHDFDPSWNGEASGGVEQVLKMAGSYPLAIVPSGGLTLRYTGLEAGAAIGARYGAAVDLLTGTLSLNQSVFLRAVKSFATVLPRQVAASVGFLHAEPLGEASSRVAAGTGNALQGDVGLIWALSDAVVANARYSIAYQYGQAAGLKPLLVQVFVVGIALRYSTAPYVPPIPSLGERVDGSDRVGFPEGSSSKQR